VKLLRIALCFCLLLVGLLAISQPAIVLAQDDTPSEEEVTTEEEVTLSCKFAKLEILSGQTAEFEVELRLLGEILGEARDFDLVATAPKDWYAYITPSYPKDKVIASIELKPGYTAGEKVLVQAIPAYWIKPEPGEYKVTLEATSGEIKGTIELTVVITAKYSLVLAPSEERLSTSATAGKDNYFSIELQNTGSAAVSNVTFSSNKPGDWAIDFSPNELDLLAPGDPQTIDVTIKPPSKTIAGDYLITLRASGEQATAEAIKIRVTVETPTIWGWVGVIIIVLVIAGLAFIFMRFSRR